MGDDDAYREDKTPFLAQHKCSKEVYTLSASTYHKAYTPRQRVAEGELAAACFGAKKTVGTVSKIVKKGRHKYVVFEGNADTYNLSKCVRLPVPNEFVRHKQTKKWFKVTSVASNGALELLPVLKQKAAVRRSPRKHKSSLSVTPSQGTPKSVEAENSAAAVAAAKTSAGENSAAAVAAVKTSAGENSAAAVAAASAGENSAAAVTAASAGENSAAAVAAASAGENSAAAVAAASAGENSAAAVTAASAGENSAAAVTAAITSAGENPAAAAAVENTPTARELFSSDSDEQDTDQVSRTRCLISCLASVFLQAAHGTL